MSIRIHRAHRFEFTEAIQHKRRHLGTLCPAPGNLKKLIGYADALIQSCNQDYYGLISKDYLIMGDDRLLNRVIAIALASRGKSSLLVESDRDVEGPYQSRFDMPFPNMSEIISAGLGILDPTPNNPDIDFTTCLGGILHHYRTPDGHYLAEALIDADIVHEHSGENHFFWVEAHQQALADVSLPGLRCWNKDKSQLFGTENGKCPQFRAVFDKVILTSSSQYSRLRSIHTPHLAMGDAKIPLPSYSVFRARDRMRDILDAIKAIIHEQDVPTSDQHHA